VHPSAADPFAASGRAERREMQALKLRLMPFRLAVCRLDPSAMLPAWPAGLPFWSVTRTDEELSLVLGEDNIPADWRAERGWRCLKVQGPLDFDQTGVLASLASPLARAGISIFAISTYDTDYLLLRELDLPRVIQVLSACGHLVDQ